MAGVGLPVEQAPVQHPRRCRIHGVHQSACMNPRRLLAGSAGFAYVWASGAETKDVLAWAKETGPSDPNR